MDENIVDDLRGQLRQGDHDRNLYLNLAGRGGGGSNTGRGPS